MADVGYVRVSTAEQHLDLQQAAMQKAGIAKVFEDHGVSGTLASRPGLDAARAFVRDGDTFVVWKLDRLGRSAKHVLELIEDLAMKGVGFRSLTEGIDTTGPMGKAMLTVLAAFNQLERDLIVERTNAGLAAAKAKGRRGGRPRVLDGKTASFAQVMYDSGNFDVQEIAAKLKVSKTTIYRYLASSKAIAPPQR